MKSFESKFRKLGYWLAGAIAALAIVCVPVASAQSTGGRIRGTVTDPSGGAVVGAKVTLTNEATNVSREAETNATGEYLFLEIPVGTYTIQLQQAGFKKFLRKGVELHLNDVLNVDLPLQVGASEQVVEVTGEPPVVDTTSTQLGAVVNSRDATQLPLNQRDVYQLLQLQPGVQSQLGNDLFYGSDKAGVVTVNGGRGRSNNYSVNGGDGNDLFANLPAVQPSPDSIEEFRVITNNFDAEYGRNSGSVINVVTKSGTNDWHGSGFEFFRNKVLNAKGFYDPSKPDSIQNQFGGTFGGPIKKDKTFFFGSYEGRRIKKGKSSNPVPLPTLANQAGDFSNGGTNTFAGTLNDQQVADTLNNRGTCGADITAAGGVAPAAGATYDSIFPNGKIPTSCFDPLSVALLGAYVHPTSDGIFQKAPNSTDSGDQFTIKVDHDINKTQKLSLYYYYDNDNSLDPFAVFQAAGGNLGNFPGIFTTRTQQINATHTWTIGSSIVNELRFSFFREGQQKFDTPKVNTLVQDSCGSSVSAICFTGTSDTGNLPTSTDFGIHPGLGASKEGLPFISVSGGFSIGNNFEGQLPQTGNTFQVSDNFSKIVGNHSLKFGGDFRYQRFDQFLYYNVNGSISFGQGGNNDLASGDGSTYPNYFLGLPSSYSQGSAQQELVRSKSIYLFAQDSWKIKPSLTLNYGLRWELNTPLNDIGHKVQTFRPGQNSTIYPCTLPTTDPLYNAGAGITDCNSAGVTPTGLVFPGDKGVPLSLTSTYYKAFAPRLGLNWSPSWHDGPLAKLTGGPSKTSITMGWGMFYNPIEQLVLEQFSAEPPFGGSNFIANPTFQSPFLDQGGTTWPNPFNGVLNPPRGTAINWETFRSILLFGEFPKVLRPQYSAQYNLTIKRELPGNILVQIGYVGSQGHRLLASYDINHGNPQTCNDLQAISTAAGDPSLACGPFSADNAYTVQPGEIPAGLTLHLPYGPTPTVTGPNAGPITLVGLRQYSSPNCVPLTGVGCPVDGVPVFSNIFSENTIAHSNYNSLQALFVKRYSRGLQFQLAYTFSKSLDNASSFESSLNPLNFNSTYGPSLYDARHRFVFSYVWQLPVPVYNGFKGALLSGWQTSGILTLQTGFPIRITSGDDVEELSSFFFEAPGEPDLVAPFHTVDPRLGGCALGTGPLAGSGAPACNHLSGVVFDQNLFTNATVLPGTIGNSPRSICCSPGIANFDAGLFKSFKITERLRSEFRAEFYNLFNHTQLYSVDGSISDGSTFGKALRAREPREIQFALKFIF
ncbi:MAG: TonB-dependent receptor [Acidobacteria bacterium]|nr:TonB-dependent receptor [Acidobacteriota bacterium]MBS1864881.1 TonB-dependent receptor [Acidobacteriota bacterium]